jgi:hypothetical protein
MRVRHKNRSDSNAFLMWGASVRLEIPVPRHGRLKLRFVRNALTRRRLVTNMVAQRASRLLMARLCPARLCPVKL